MKLSSILPLLLVAVGCTTTTEMHPSGDPLGYFASREDHLQRLEPRGNRILHGAGANPEDFAEYWEELARTPPLLYATHLDLMWLREDWAFALIDVLARYPAYVIPQIALSMTHEGSSYANRVASGELDVQLDIFCAGLRALGRPAFVRVGYGFNSPLTGYRPDSYRRAWTRVAETIHLRHQLDDVATVWCYAADRAPSDFMPFYPGDQYVDWWGIDLFDPLSFQSESTLDFMAAASERGYQVMIGEAAPRGPGIEPDSGMWERWFRPFFRFVRGQPGVKAFCYISWYVGNTRIAADLDVLQRYRDELDDDNYLHATSLEELRWELEWED